MIHYLAHYLTLVCSSSKSFIEKDHYLEGAPIIVNVVRVPVG